MVHALLSYQPEQWVARERYFLPQVQAGLEAGSGRSEVNRNDMVRMVMQRIGARDMEEAEMATRSVLAALTDGISRDEAQDLAGQLPQEFADFVTGRMNRAIPAREMSMETFVDRIQSDLDLETWDQGERVARGVFAVLKEAISPDEVEDVARELPSALRDVLVTS